MWVEPGAVVVCAWFRRRHFRSGEIAAVDKQLYYGAAGAGVGWLPFVGSVRMSEIERVDGKRVPLPSTIGRRNHVLRLARRLTFLGAEEVSVATTVRGYRCCGRWMVPCVIPRTMLNFGWSSTPTEGIQSLHVSPPSYGNLSGVFHDRVLRLHRHVFFLGIQGTVFVAVDTRRLFWMDFRPCVGTEI